MTIGQYLMAGALSILVGLDRVAFAQFMISRPIVVGPLTGFLLGNSLVGLEIGMLLELLWLGRLPVGAAIPPDDTQIALGATVMALSMEKYLGLHGMPMVILAVLIAIPLGKLGQLFDRLARHINDRFNDNALKLVAINGSSVVERMHLYGLASFALASLVTAMIIILCGTVILYYAAPLLIDTVRVAGLGLQYSLVLIGAAALLGTINVSRGLSLFCAAFTGTLLVMWLK